MSDKANELAEVKRYDLRLCDGDSGNCHAEMYRSDDGDYVEYAAIAAELTRLAAGLESVWAACHHIRIGGKDAVESMIAVIKQREKDCIELNGVCAHQSARLEKQQSKLDRYRWIPVDERLPPDEMSVLAFKSNGHVDKTCRYAGGWLLPSLEPHVTHWMPLPEPPK